MLLQECFGTDQYQDKMYERSVLELDSDSLGLQIKTIRIETTKAEYQHLFMNHKQAYKTG